MATIGDYVSAKGRDTKYDIALQKALEDEGYKMDMKIADVAIDPTAVEDLIDKLSNKYNIKSGILSEFIFEAEEAQSLLFLFLFLFCIIKCPLIF